MKPLIALLIIIIIWILIWIIGSYLTVASIEEPNYEVLEKGKGYEIRQYDSYIVAETEINGSGQQVLNQGFRILAGYIFGWNTSKASIAMTTPVNDIQKNEKIAMTTPVNDITTWDNIHLVQFTMPSSYTLETLPIPNDNRVKLREIKPQKKAVLRYTLWATESVVEKNKQKLAKLLTRDGIDFEAEMVSAQYNPPLSFPLMRRNEILVEIK